MKKSILLLLAILTFHANSQDSLGAKQTVPARRHEIGINILPPFLILAGVNSSQPNFFNATYRYLLNEHHALRVTAGINVFHSDNHNDQSYAVSMANNLTIYRTTSTNSPINIGSGIGYERILGKRKLKHVIGFDLTYNYVNEQVSSYYHGMKDSTFNNYHSQEYVPIDTGATTFNRYYHKFDITPFYSVRYALSSRWLATASTRFNFQGYTVKNPGYPNVTNFDFNMSGLISEISLFYRF